MSYTVLKEANGKYVAIDDKEIMESFLKSNLTIEGMSLETIFAFRRIYVEKGGIEPITPDSVREILRRK